MPLRPILPGIFHLDFPWTNAWLLLRGDEAAIIVSGTCRDRPALLAMLGEALPEGARLQSVLLTHGHCDHAGNAAFLADIRGAGIVTHREEEPYVAGNRSYARSGFRTMGVSSIIFRLADVFYPVSRHPVERILTDGDKVETPIGDLLVVETPGHTCGHISYFHEREGWLFSGDALLSVIPFVQRPGLSLAPPIFSLNMRASRESARKIAALGPCVLFPGHGWALTEDTLARIRSFTSGLDG